MVDRGREDEERTLSFRDKEEYHDQRDHIEAGVEAESTGDAEGAEDIRERDGEDGGPEEAGGDYNIDTLVHELWQLKRGRR